jgi:hypothetical protein
LGEEALVVDLALESVEAEFKQEKNEEEGEPESDDKALESVKKEFKPKVKYDIKKSLLEKGVTS